MAVVGVAGRFGLAAGLVAWSASAGATPAATPPQDITARATPAVRVLGDQEGLPQSTVATEAFDASGRLWVGTQAGLAVYDGRAFRRVPLPDAPASDWVTALAVLPDDTLAVGTHDDGVWLIHDGRFEHATAPAALPDASVRSLAALPIADRARELWVGTRHGLARHLGSNWSAIEIPTALGGGDSVTALAFGPDGAAWIGTASGIATFSGGTWRTYRGGDAGLPRSAVNDLLVETAADGRSRVLASTEAGLAILEGDSWRVLSSRDGLPCDDVGPVVRARDALWVGTLCGGLSRVEGTRVTATIDSHDSPLPSDLVRSMLAGRPEQGPPALWLGTDTGGVARVALGGFRALEAPGSPGRVAVYALGWTHADDGALVTWIGTESGLTRYDGRQWTPVKIPTLDAAESYVNAIVPARGASQRGLWVGTFGGAARLRRDQWTVYAEASGLPSTIVLTLYEATGPRGEPELLAGLRPGFARFTGDGWQAVTEPGAPTHEEVTSMVETGPPASRVLWIATAGSGLFRREAGTWTHLVAASSSLPSDDILQVQRVVLRGGERLFVSTGEAGIAWLDPATPSAKWSSLTSRTTPALPDPLVYGVQQDSSGRIYAFTNHGIARLTAKAAEPDGFDLDVLTTEDGLPSGECNTGGSGVDPLGRVWAGTVAGAAVLDPRDEPEDRTPKKLLLDETLVLDQPFDLAAHGDLPYDRDTLAFELSLLSLHRGGDTRYRTQLVGLERDPSAWTPDPRVRFAGLGAGRYELRAWGRDYAGNVSGPLVVPFRIQPAPWATWWAWSAYAILAASLVTSGYRWRIATLRSRARELEGHVAERTAQLAAKVRELDRKNLELLESQRRADRIFSAFADVLPGSILDGKYRIDRKLGAGGFGTVFQAHQLSLDREVAVKIFRPQPGNDSAVSLERFQREGMSACRVNHPNAIQVYDSGLSTDGIPYIVMELLEGQTLAACLREQGALSLRRAIDIAIPFVEALAAAHDAGLIHRDIKPDNVFLHGTREGETVKLLDFGIAKLLEGEDQALGEEATAAFVGTPRYMAPERLMRGATSRSSDVYGAGVVLYEMIAGRAPWPKTVDMFVLVARIMAGIPVSMTDLGVPEAVASLVMRTLSHEPADRPSAEQLARALMAARATLTPAELETVYGDPATSDDDGQKTEEAPLPPRA
jgi:ligand-binding sensor domain-containing protein